MGQSIDKSRRPKRAVAKAINSLQRDPPVSACGPESGTEHAFGMGRQRLAADGLTGLGAA